MNKRKRMCWTLGFVSILLVLGGPSTSGAQTWTGQTWAGTQTGAAAQTGAILPGFHPFITVGETYDTNILLTKTDRLDDFITTVDPGFTFYALSEKNYGINLNFVAGYTYYAKNHEFSYFSPGGTLNAWYALSSDLTFRIRDYLIRSDQAREDLYTEGALPDQFLLSTERGVHAIYIRNVVEPTVEYHFGKEDLFSVLYRNDIYHNDNPLFQNSQENTIEPKLAYWFDVRNGVTLDYFIASGSYARSSSPDQLGQGARARYTYRFDPTTSIFGEYYFEWQSFKSPGVNYDVHNPSLGIEYKFSPTLVGLVQGGYFWQIPERGSKTQDPSFNVSLIKNLAKTTYTLAFQGGYTEDYFTAQNLGFLKYYRAYGTISHKLTERLTVGATGSVERAIYPSSSGQKDWIWGIWGNVSYRVLKWLSVSIEPAFIQDHSTLNTQYYSDFRGMFKVTATY